MRSFLLLAATGLAGCAHVSAPVQPHDEFFANISRLCGQAFEGRVTSPPVEADASFAGKKLIMHVQHCSSDMIRIPFQVGEDRSRTWVVTRADGRLTLRHDHRHEDGTEDRVSQYGGDTRTAGTASLDFYADEFTATLIPAAATNIWTIAVDANTFRYGLRREGRRFRVEFDLR